MNKELFRVLWRRNRWFLLIFVGVILSFFLLSYQSDSSRWQADREQFQKDAGSVLEQRRYENEALGEEKKETSEEEYLYDQSKLFIYDNLSDEVEKSINWQSLYFGNSIEQFLFFLIGLSVFLLFSLDYSGKFSYYLFHSRFSRKQSYWVKLLFVMGTVLVAVVLGMTLYYGLFKHNIPSKFFDDVPRMLFKSGVLLVLKTVWVVSFSSFLGIVCGEMFTGMILFIFLWETGSGIVLSIHNFLMIFYGHSRTVDRLVDWFSREFYRMFNWHILRFSDNYSQIFFYLFFSSLFIGASYYCYQKVSLENIGSFLIFPKLQRIACVGLVSYCVLLQASGNLFFTFQWVPSEGDPYLSIILLFGSLTAIFVTPLVYLLVYRRLPLIHHSFKLIRGKKE